MQLNKYLTGIRGKLITVFVLIKVIPLVLLAWFAWHAITNLGEDVSNQSGGMAENHKPLWAWKRGVSNLAKRARQCV